MKGTQIYVRNPMLAPAGSREQTVIRVKTGQDPNQDGGDGEKGDRS